MKKYISYFYVVTGAACWGFIGVFNSVANLIFLITANKISARLSETSLW